MKTRITLVVLLPLSALLARGDDWPQWRGPKLDGVSAEKGWSTQWPEGGPKKLWSRNTGISCSSVAVVGNRVYTMGNEKDQDHVSCLDAATGTPVWKFSYVCPLAPKQFEGGSGATPTVDGDRVYTLSRSGHLFCLNAKDGKPVWSKHLVDDLGGKVPTWGYSGSPLVHGNLLVLDVGAPGGSVVAFDKMTGAVVWKAGDEAAGYGTVVPFKRDGRDLLASFNAFGLVIRAAKDGAFVAKFPWKTSYDVNAATPVLSGNRIFISSGYNRGCAVVEFTGSDLKPIWESKKLRNHFNSSVLVDGFLYGFDESTLTCVEFATGIVKWREEGLGKGSLMIADGKLVVLGENGQLAVAPATAAGFKPLAKARVLDKRCWVVPVLANGRIYAKNNEGDMVCLDVSGR